MDRPKGAMPVRRCPVRCDRRGVDTEMAGILSLWHRMKAVGGPFVLVRLEGQNPVNQISLFRRQERLLQGQDLHPLEGKNGCEEVGRIR